MGGWDTRNDGFNSHKRMRPALDKGLGTLVRDLAEMGLLRETLVACCSEFGRTPEINAGKGRDHWANGFSVVLAGAGIRRGVVYGSTGINGHNLTDPVSPSRLFTTIYTALGIDPNKTFGLSPDPTRDTYIWPRSEPIPEILAIGAAARSAPVACPSAGR